MIRAERWKEVEVSFTATETYELPYRDVDMEVRFTGPDGQVITRPAF